MERALLQAELALTRRQTPFGAVVVSPEGHVIGEGHDTVRADLDPSADGEIGAIRAACRQLGTWRLTGCTLYTSCEPCLLCSFAIVQIGIRRVVDAARGTDVPTYRPILGADFQEAAEWLDTQPDRAPIDVVADFMRDRAREILAAFPWR
jgi:tRNA(adenine34) deaminase